jgi:predicted ATPase
MRRFEANRLGLAAIRESRSKRAICSLPLYGWFTEGFDTRDLKEAKALLDELAA